MTSAARRRYRKVIICATCGERAPETGSRCATCGDCDPQPALRPRPAEPNDRLRDAIKAALKAHQGAERTRRRGTALTTAHERVVWHRLRTQARLVEARLHDPAVPPGERAALRRAHADLVSALRTQPLEPSPRRRRGHAEPNGDVTSSVA